MASKAKCALVNAFLELTKSERYEKITVTSLVEKCSISRQTFYYHFNDIHEMLKWAVESETEAICQNQTEGNWIESAKLYTDFLYRYDSLIRGAAKSTDFILIFNLLSKSFEIYINSYLSKKRKNHNLINRDYGFLIHCMSLSYTGLIVEEIQKEESDYEALLKEIFKSFQQIPNN